MQVELRQVTYKIGLDQLARQVFWDLTAFEQVTVDDNCPP